MPAAPSALFAAAVAHHRAGRLAEAAAGYQKILAADPRHLDALYHLALLLLAVDQPADAEPLLAHALALRPRVAPLHLQHGLALRALRRPDEALAAFRRASSLDPKHAEARHQAGNLLKSLRLYREALIELRAAAQLAPDQAAIWLNLGVAALESDARDEALAAFQRAAALEPQRAETHNILGHTLAAAGRGAEARAAFAEALRLRPDYAAAHNNLGRLAKAEGLLDEAVAHYRAAIAAQPSAESAETHSNLLFALNYLADLPPADVFAEHRRWHALHAASIPLLPQRATNDIVALRGSAGTSRLPPSDPPASIAPPPPVLPRRLRLGYLSPDFNHHAVAYFIEPILAAHDRTRFEIFCYANVRTPDAFTARLQSLAEHWRDIASLDDDDAAALIRADQLDLLIDLAGHTAHNRLLVLARRPAPVQATWIGYPNTTGLDTIDYRITDAISDPVGTTEAFHSEKLVRLPTTFSCYRPDERAPAVNALPATAPGAVTFGCFNNFAKLTPAVLALWADLLRQLPHARLLLKSRGLGDPAVIARLRTTFANHGIAADRLTLDGRELSVADHLALYHGVDVALDPFPYNGTTTTCEALWMGVPVITLAGCVHAARVGASLLTHTGLAEWIAATPDDYTRLALAAAQDLPRLAALRASLRERLRTSPLCDAATFTRGFEAACLAMAEKPA